MSRRSVLRLSAAGALLTAAGPAIAGCTTVPPPASAPYGGLVDDGAYAAAAGTAGRSVVRLPPPWAIDDGMRHAVLNVGLAELVDNADAYRPGSLDAALRPLLDWNTANPGRRLRVKVRLHAGERAPASWLERCGPVVVSDESFAKLAAVPRWWARRADGTYPYRSAYGRAMAALAAVIEDPAGPFLPVVSAVTVPLAAFFYPEPLLLFLGSRATVGGQEGTNLDRLRAAGWTDGAHRAFLRWAVGEGHAAFRRVPLALALNPYVGVDAAGAQISDTAFAVDLADAFHASRPGLFVAENYSWREAYVRAPAASAYGQLYTAFDRWAAEGRTVGVQLARPHRLPAPLADAGGSVRVVWAAVAAAAADRGWSFVETCGGAAGRAEGTANEWPNAWQDDRPAVRRLDAALRANANA